MKLPSFLTKPNPDIYRSNNYVVLDFETTNIGKGSALIDGNSIVLAVWGLGSAHPNMPPSSEAEQHSAIRRRWAGRGAVGYNIKWANEYGLGELVRDIEAADFIVCHNAKFELQWLERCGVDLSNIVVYDTMLAEYVIGGNRWQMQRLSLDRISQRRKFGQKSPIVSLLIKLGVCPSLIPESWLEKYCVRDVELTWKLFTAQLKEFTSFPKLLPIVYTRCLLTPVLADVEKNGMQLDCETVTKLTEEKEAEYARFARDMEELAGGINIRSHKQRGEFVYDTLGFEQLTDYRGNVLTTEAGNPKTDADTIKALKARTEKQKAFKKLYIKGAELNGELTKYLRKFSDCCKDAGGWLRATFHQTTTKTHRLSSSGLDYAAQFQNFPRVYKPLFRSRHAEWLVGEADGAQLEFRIAVHLGRDSIGLDDIKGGTDVHAVTAGIIGCSRQDAKAHTFKPLYGGSSGTRAQKKYYQFFKDKYKGIAKAQRRWINAVLEQGFLETEWGLRYFWPDTRMESGGYVTNSTSICNYPVQAFATAEIIPIAIVFFWHRLQRSDYKMFLVNTIHDSIITELPPEEVEAFHELSKQCLVYDIYPYLSAAYGVKLTVPLGCGVKIGKNWGTGEEVTYEAEEALYIQDS